MPTTAEILRRAAARVERGWCRGAYARDARGNPVADGSEPARSWCALGAIHAETPIAAQLAVRNAAVAALRRAVHSIPGQVAEWNDAAPDAATVADALRRAADEAG